VDPETKKLSERIKLREKLYNNGLDRHRFIQDMNEFEELTDIQHAQCLLKRYLEYEKGQPLILLLVKIHIGKTIQ
jgi:hypothetical protein